MTTPDATRGLPGPLESVLDRSGRLDDPIRVIRLDEPTDLPVADGGHILVGVLLDGPLDNRGRDVAARLDVSYVGPQHDHPPDPVVTVDDPAAACRRTIAAIRSNPYATQVLRSELSATSALPIRAALDVESFAYSTLLGGSEFGRWITERGPRPRPPVAHDPVLVARHDGVLSVVLNRPDRRNAYGTDVRDALCDALDIAIADPTITSIMLSGAGPAFCAGGDLDEFGTTPDPVVAHTIRTIAGAGRRMADVADRVTVRVHGACVGAGIEIPAFAATVIADPDAWFRLPEIGMGLIPGAGGTVSIARRIGRWRTFHLAVSGDIISATTALKWGLVDRIEAITPAPA